MAAETEWKPPAAAIEVVMRAIYEGRLGEGEESRWSRLSEVSKSILWPDADFILKRLHEAGWVSDGPGNPAATYQG